MAVNDIWRLSCVGSRLGTSVLVITLHIKFLSVGATFDGAAAYIKTNLLDLLKTYQHNGFRWDQINGNSVNLTPPVADQYSTGFPLVGVINEEALPPQCAMVVTLRTAYSGRSYRGRLYIPGTGESHQSGGSYDSTIRNAVQTYFDDLVAGIGSGGSSTDYQWGVYSRKLATFTPINDTTVRSTVYTQRRRTIGAGA